MIRMKEPEKILEAKDICKAYGKNMVLNQVNLTIKAGEIYGLVGENGAGKSSLMKVITGLTKPTSGADDYITKPFYHEEVLARIESVLRRCSESPQTEYSFKDIRINVDDHKVLVNNTELTLTTTEYNLLQLLIKHPKQTFTKESLYQLIWGKDYISDDNTLNVHISKLRKKLEHIGNQAPYIDTVWGIGYKLHR